MGATELRRPARVPLCLIDCVASERIRAVQVQIASIGAVLDAIVRAHFAMSDIMRRAQGDTLSALGLASLTVSQISGCPLRAAQHGQRESVVARAATNLRRIVAIEFGTWRSGRNGGSSGLVTFA